MARLRECFGQNKYPSDRVDIFWDRFKHLDNQIFSKAVSRLIANENHAPLLERIAEEISLLGGSNWREDEIERLRGLQNCSVCKNTGRYHTPGRVPGEAAFNWGCTCKLGEFAYPNYPRQNGQYKIPEPIKFVLPESMRNNS